MNDKIMTQLKSKERVYMIYVLKLKYEIVNQLESEDIQNRIDIKNSSNQDRLFNYSYCSDQDEDYNNNFDNQMIEGFDAYSLEENLPAT